MKSRHTFIKVTVIFSLFLLLFSALAIAVLYIGQSAEKDAITNQSGFDVNKVIQTELSGNSLIIDQDNLKDTTTGDIPVLPKGN